MRRKVPVERSEAILICIGFVSYDRTPYNIHGL